MQRSPYKSHGRKIFIMTSGSNTFPKLVKEVRKQLGITQEELAHELGVSFATINRWENGKTTPFKLARREFDNYCARMARQGKLSLPRGDK